MSSRYVLLVALLGACAAAPSRQLSVAPMSPGEGGRGGDSREELGRLVQQLELSRAAAGLPPRSPADAPASAGAPSAPAALADRPAPAAPPGGERCEAVCRAGRDICRYSEQICRLAEDLGDEDSRRSCLRAQGDCADATRLCKRCR